MKLGFIGVGNMAQAIIKGLLKAEFLPAQEIYIYNKTQEKAALFADETGVQVVSSLEEIAEVSDTLVLSVKPHIIEEVLAPISQQIASKNTLLLSIAAGKTLASIQEMASSASQPIIRVMPNVNVQIGLGASAVCGNANASSEQLNFALEMFASVGKSWLVEEKDFSAYIAMAGSSPAFTYLYIDSLARAGVKHGLSKEKALEYAAQATLGSAATILETKENPWALIDSVCSPGGTTVAGLLALEENAFLATVVKGVDATIAKDIEMSKK